MTDNEIIKALKCCKRSYVKCNKDCPRYYGFYDNISTCKNMLIKESLDLIKQQKAEIEKLETTKNAYKLYYEKTVLLLTDAYKTAEQVSTNWEIGKINAIKEFAERLKEKLQWDFEFENKIVFENDIDNLVKEMTEVNENDRA